jgi:hypothetical protein
MFADVGSRAFYTLHAIRYALAFAITPVPCKTHNSLALHPPHLPGFKDGKFRRCGAFPFGLSETGSMKTLKVSLLATGIGTGAWLLGVDRIIWPAHPGWAAFLLTLGATVVLMSVVPGNGRQKADGE